MSRREIVVNTLLGAFLLMAALFIFLSFLAGFVLVRRGVEHLVQYFFPGVALPKLLLLLTIFCVYSLVSSVGHLRHHRWRNAFLSLAVTPVIASIWFADASSPLERDGFLVMWLPLIVLVIPERSSLPRSEFLLGAFMVAGIGAVNAGLFGSGMLAHASSNSILVAAFVWLLIRGRERWRVQSPDPQASPSPTPTHA